MKHLPTFASLLVLMILMAEIFPLARIRGHWLVMVYLVCQFAFTLSCWLGLQKFGVDGGVYKRVFLIGFAAVSIASCSVAATWLASLNLENALVVIISAAVLCCACGMVLTQAENVEFYIACGVVMLIPATMGFASCVARISAADTYVRLGLSSFWLLIAMYFFIAAASQTNVNLGVIPKRGWIPSVAAIVIFGCLALALHGAQKEGSYAVIQAQEAQR